MTITRVNPNTVTRVKGNAESAYRTGDVNLTPANIGALALSGGTLTGNESLKDGTIDRDAANNTDGQAGRQVSFVDKDGERIGLIRTDRDANGIMRTKIGTFTENSSNEEVSNWVMFGVNRNGTRYYSVSDAPKFRSDLGITPANIGAAPSSHSHGAGDITSGTLAIARGGTGVSLSAAPSIITNLASTSGASPFAASPRPGVTGTLGIAHGGTGKTTKGEAWEALGGGALGKKDSVSIGRETWSESSPGDNIAANSTKSFSMSYDAPSGKSMTGLYNITTNQNASCGVMAFDYNAVRIRNFTASAKSTSVTYKWVAIKSSLS